MKIPPWIQRCLIMLMALAAGAGLWLAWLEWPRQTAIEFVQLIASGNFDGANSQLRGGARWKTENGWGIVTVTTNGNQERSWTDVVLNNPYVRDNSQWVRLDLEHGSDLVAYSDEFVLPADVWRAWFRDRVVSIHRRTLVEMLAGRQRFSTIEGHLQFEARFGRVFAQVGQSEFWAFISERNPSPFDDRPRSVAFVSVEPLSTDEQFEFLGPR